MVCGMSVCSKWVREEVGDGGLSKATVPTVCWQYLAAPPGKGSYLFWQQKRGGRWQSISPGISLALNKVRGWGSSGVALPEAETGRWVQWGQTGAAAPHRPGLPFGKCAPLASLQLGNAAGRDASPTVLETL